MCAPPQDDPKTAAPSKASGGKLALLAAAFFGVTTIALLVSTVILAVDNGSTDIVTVAEPSTRGPPAGTNPCEGTDPKLENVACVAEGMEHPGGQSGANVTKGYQGLLDAGDVVPITDAYYKVGLCPVNVHWHLGAEHYSLGQYDETGTGPAPKSLRRNLAGNVKAGFQCTLYDGTDPKFTTPYDWKFCKDMQVGETYEVHWPHSAAGACGTVNQYQTPFYDGVFCLAGRTVNVTDTAAQVGVQAQIFTVVNDESYYYPDLIRGMIVDGNKFGSDVAKYTGSTTGPSRDNDVCSVYSPITWQVDRKCHMISASTFDKMCADMKAQRDDMTDDLHPHGSRDLVAHENAHNNHQGLRA